MMQYNVVQGKMIPVFSEFGEYFDDDQNLIVNPNDSGGDNHEVGVATVTGHLNEIQRCLINTGPDLDHQSYSQQLQQVCVCK